ncbi:MAG: glycosyltransferase [Candidatus Omnitrophota bacterium]
MLVTTLSHIKNTPLLYASNALFRGFLQEEQIKRELLNYQAIARQKGIHPLNIDELRSMLQKRMQAKKKKNIAKEKGSLRIFLIYELFNWERVLPLALKEFGQVVEFEFRSSGFNTTSKAWRRQRKDMNSAIRDYFFKINLEKSIDIVVCYLSGRSVDKKVLMDICSNVPAMINFSWDDKLHYRGERIDGQWSGPAALADAVDLNLTNAPESCIKYAVDGGLAMFWPEAASVEIHKPQDVYFEFDVSFIGKRYGWRPELVKTLNRSGIKVKCFGDGWENKALSQEEMVRLYSRSRINLGFSGVGYAKNVKCLKGRDFEVPMNGGLYLTQENPELNLVYEVGREIVVYRDARDCVDKIKWLLNNPDEAEKIREAGRERALKDHTWEKRFSDVFRLLGVMN